MDLGIIVVIEEPAPHLWIVTLQIRLLFDIGGCWLAADTIGMREVKPVHRGLLSHVLLRVITVHLY